MSETNDKLAKLREQFAKQLSDCETKIEALKIQREQLMGAVYAMDKALTVTVEEQNSNETKES